MTSDIAAVKVPATVESVVDEMKRLREAVSEMKKEVASVKAASMRAKERLDLFEPTGVEKMLGGYKDRVKQVGEIINTCILRATVATELSFFARNAGQYQRDAINSDVIYALDLPHSFWCDNYSEVRTIEEWVMLIRRKRLGGTIARPEAA